MAWSDTQGCYIYRGGSLASRTHGDSLCGPSTRGWADDMIFILSMAMARA